jgi:hypothetical protein
MRFTLPGDIQQFLVIKLERLLCILIGGKVNLWCILQKGNKQDNLNKSHLFIIQMVNGLE